MRGRQRVRSTMTHAGERARMRFHDTSGAMRERGHHAMDAARSRVGHRPLASVAAAFAAGVVVATAMERKWRCFCREPREEYRGQYM